MHIIEGKQHYNLDIKLRLYVKRYMVQKMLKIIKIQVAPVRFVMGCMTFKQHTL